MTLDESEMENLGIKQDEVILDLEIGDVVTVLSGAWEGTVGAVQTINEQKKSLTINVELFGRETPPRHLRIRQAEGTCSVGLRRKRDRDGNARRPLREGGVAHQQDEHQTCGQPADALGA